ncbi:hypothetical protein [Kiloniella laminariae]|uniref:hypothetical protein n=1 Tax=Kiloniella laminariae TaxID=454162 RepID=UPI00036AC4EA|nr:hypothetical protein [Kiloniella laminariae]
MPDLVIRLLAFALLFFFTLSSLSAEARADWTADFVPPETPQSVLRVDLPEDLDILTLTTLAVELDGIDITALLSLDDNDFTYQPVEPLAGGEHLLRLVLLGGDGTTTEKGRWLFQIEGAAPGVAGSVAAPSEAEQIAQAEALLRSATFRADTLTEFSSRVLQQNIGHETNDNILSGGGDGNAAFASENWDIRAHANYLVQSDLDQSLTGHPADIGEYDITADFTGDSMKGGMTLGHHDIGLQTQLVSDFYRRGSSVRLGTLDERFEAQGFAFGTSSVAGANDFTGLNDSDDRIKGLTASVKPFSDGIDDIDALKITGLYYDGTGDGGGIGLEGEGGDLGSSSTGSGWGLVLEKGFDQQRTRLRGEYAHALFDQDGSTGEAPKDGSDAISLSADHRLFEQGPVVFDDVLEIDVGVGYDRVETFFASLANPGLIGDREAYSAYSNIYWGALSGNFYLLDETNNVDDLASTPTDRLRSLDASLNYSFDPQSGSMEWLGTPYVGLSGFVATLEREKTPDGYTGPDTDSLSKSVTFTVGSSYSDWYWSASQSYARFDDETNETSDTVNHLSGINAGWSVSDRLDIYGGTQFGVFEEEDSDKLSYNTNLSLGVSAELVPEKLDLNLDYNLNLANGSGDTPDSHIVNSEVEWTFLQPRSNRPGLALAVRGSMEETNGSTDSTENETDYQVYMLLRVKAPFAFGY